MTTPDPGKDTRLVPIKGRNIVVRQLVDAQMVLMAREARILQKDRDEIPSARKFAAVGRMFDIFESAVVQEEDREYLMDLVVAGNLELKDMMGFLTAFSDNGDEEEKPKVRRGRPPTKRSAA